MQNELKQAIRFDDFYALFGDRGIVAMAWWLGGQLAEPIRRPDGLTPEISAVASRNQKSMNGEIISRLEHSLFLELALDIKNKIIMHLINRIADLEAKAPAINSPVNRTL